MSFADRIIDHGPATAGDMIPPFVALMAAADFNELREHLIEARDADARRAFDWPAALDAVGGGHNLVSIERVRTIMAAAGVHGLPLHKQEQEEVARLRGAAKRNLAAADEIEARAR